MATQREAPDWIHTGLTVGLKKTAGAATRQGKSGSWWPDRKAAKRRGRGLGLPKVVLSGLSALKNLYLQQKSSFLVFKLTSHIGFTCGSSVKNLPAMQETLQVRYLGREDPLEKEIATHSSTLA